MLNDDFIPGDATLVDISRNEAIWNHCIGSYGTDGPWLFGRYSIADAMLAPVVLRFRRYGITLDGDAGNYVSTVLKQPAIEEWLNLAAKPQIG